MTLFSYAVSNLKNKQYREPEILANLIERLIPSKKKHFSGITGWLAHYAVGILFTMMYHTISQKTKSKPVILAGSLLGTATGLFGILIWKKVLRLHPLPPALDRRDYYRHLFAAHLVFGIFTALGYRVVKNKSGAQINSTHS